MPLAPTGTCAYTSAYIIKENLDLKSKSLVFVLPRAKLVVRFLKADSRGSVLPGC